MRPKKQRPIVVTQRDRALARLRTMLIASVAALVVGLTAFALIVGDEFSDLEAALSQERDERAAFQSALNEANRDLVQAGEEPVDPPAVAEQGEQGLPGEPGRDGRPPTAAEIREAVASYCAAGQCRGPAGSSVTPAQVAGAVSAYCNARGQCRGPLGVAGRNGADGGPGPTGPPPTDAQVAAAVSAFCAGGRCQGAIGPQGPPGPAGPPGADGQPGPTCPPGFTPQQRLVITDDGPEQATLCVAG